MLPKSALSDSEINPNLSSETPKIKSTHSLVLQAHHQAVSQKHAHAPKTTREKLKHVGEHLHEDAKVLAELPELAANISKLLDDGNISLVIKNAVYTIFATSVAESIITMTELMYKHKEKFDLVFYERLLMELIERFSFMSTLLIGLYALDQGLVGKNSEEESTNYTPLFVILAVSFTIAALSEKKIWMKIHHPDSRLRHVASVIGEGLLAAGEMRALLYNGTELIGTALQKDEEELLLNENWVMARYAIAIVVGIIYSFNEMNKIRKQQHHDDNHHEHEAKGKITYAKDTVLALVLTLNLLMTLNEASEELNARITMATCISLLTLILLKGVQIGKKVDYSSVPESAIQIDELTDEEAALLSSLPINDNGKVAEPEHDSNNNNIDYDSDEENPHKQTNQHCNLFQLAKKALPCFNNEKTNEQRMEI